MTASDALAQGIPLLTCMGRSYASRMAASLLVLGNFIADLMLAWSDPRIRLK